MLDKVLSFLNSKTSINLQNLYIGNNFLSSASIEKLLTVIIRLKPHIKNLDLTFSSFEPKTLTKLCELLSEN